MGAAHTGALGGIGDVYGVAEFVVPSTVNVTVVSEATSDVVEGPVLQYEDDNIF